MSNRPNVILLVWDAVSARNTSLHGYHRDTTPFLDSFVEEDAVQYTQARATSSWTFPSHASMITGLYPQEHQATSKTSKFALQDQALPTLLEREGYRTVLMTNNTYLRAQEFGFSNSFGSILSDSLVSAGGKTVADPEIHAKVHGNGEYLSFIKQSLRSSSPAKSLLKGVTHKFKTSNSLSRGSGSGKKKPKGWDEDDGAKSYLDLVIDRIEAEENPFFGLINLLETHAPYQPPPGYRNFVTNDEYNLIPQTPPWEYYSRRHPAENLDDMEDLYDGCIQYLDQVSKSLITRLDEHGALDDTIIIIAGDHDDGFGESGTCRDRCIGHISGIEERLLHVPLVVKYPDQQYGGESVSELVSLKDIYATVLSEVTEEFPEDSEQSYTLHPDTPFHTGVLAHRNGLTQKQLNAISRELDEMGPDCGLESEILDQHLIAYFENGEDEMVNKYAYSVQRDCETVKTTMPNGSTTTITRDHEWIQPLKSRGRDAFERLEPVVHLSEGEMDVSRTTEDQLESLGYL